MITPRFAVWGQANKMPGLIQETPFKTITVKKLHPTFGAEIEGVDFDNLTDEQFGEIKAALTKVRPQPHAHLPDCCFLPSY